MNQMLFNQKTSQSTPIERSRPMRILMICGLYTMPYRIMRCAAAAGADIYIVGNELSTGFRHSRIPKKFVLSPIAFDGSATPEMLEEINRYIAEFDIDMVIAGDAMATRSLTGLRSHIKAPCFPMPSLEQFDTLNNKWIFTQMCGELGIPCPASRLFETREDLLRAIEVGEVKLPSMAKALSMNASHGIYKLDTENARATVASIEYSPILVQDFIPGADIGASIYCEGGEIRSFILHILKRATYTAFDNESVRDALTRIARKAKIDGVYNFDMRLAADGRIYYLECNPRFFYKINLSMLAGINFVQAGLPGGATQATVPSGTRVSEPKAFLAMLPTPWRLIRRDFTSLAYFLSDPIPYVRELLRIEYEA
jgi:hypothetical protein